MELGLRSAMGRAFVCACAMGMTGAAGSPEVFGQTTDETPLSVQALADRAASGAWDTFSATVSIRRELVAADGEVAALPVLADEFVWVRATTGTGWKTTVTIVSATKPAVHTRSGAVALPEMPAVARLEDWEDGSGPRLFARDGTLLALPSASARERFGGLEASAVDPALVHSALDGTASVRPAVGREWIHAFVMSPDGRADRLRAIERQFGRKVGTVRGLGQYVREGADGRRELLVDEDSGVPVESRLTDAGVLVARSTFSYDRAASGAVVRRGVRHERVVAGPGGARIVADLTYRNVRLVQRGGRP